MLNTEVCHSINFPGFLFGRSRKGEERVGRWWWWRRSASQWWGQVGLEQGWLLTNHLRDWGRQPFELRGGLLAFRLLLTTKARCILLWKATEVLPILLTANQKTPLDELGCLTLDEDNKFVAVVSHHQHSALSHHDSTGIAAILPRMIPTSMNSIFLMLNKK